MPRGVGAFLFNKKNMGGEDLLMSNLGMYQWIIVAAKKLVDQ